MFNLPGPRKSFTLALAASILITSQATAWALGQQCIGCEPAPAPVAIRNHVPAASLLDTVPPAPVVRPVAPRPAVAALQAPTRLPAVQAAPVSASDTRANVVLGKQLAAQRGWTGAEWDALYTLWSHESGWNEHEYGPWVRGARACGIPQRYPCNGLDAMSVRNQIIWGLDYIAGRYGRPSVAWGGWYARGASY